MEQTQPNYVVRKTAWTAVTPLRVIFFWLIIPLIKIIAGIIERKHYVIEFYDDHIITKSGVFNKNESRSAFVGVVGVSAHQSFWGGIFNYGDVRVDVVGKWDIGTVGIINPKGLKEYLEQYLVKQGQVHNTFVN